MVELSALYYSICEELNIVVTDKEKNPCFVYNQKNLLSRMKSELENYAKKRGYKVGNMLIEP